MSILFAILLFSLLIFLHELGHFAAAKSFGVRVNEFSMFMGPVLWQKQAGETLYSLRLIPFGGFCAMEGEDGDSEDPRSFSAVSWWKRMVILVAGAGMNFITGVVLFAIFLMPNEQFILPQIDSVDPKCTFYGEQGVLPGDTIWEIDGERIYVYSDFSLIMSLNEGDYHDLTVIRDGEKRSFSNVPMIRQEITDELGTRLLYGINFSVTDANFLQTWKYTWNTTLDTVRMVRLSLRMLVSGQAGFQDVSGPVGIVQQMSEVADASGSVWYAFLNLLYFGGFIAINLAVMNLLPIPALDGGRVAGLLLTTAVEAITRKKIDPKYEGYIHAAGMLVLLAFMAIVMFKDIWVIFKR